MLLKRKARAEQPLEETIYSPRYSDEAGHLHGPTQAELAVGRRIAVDGAA
jgi:hypothetical protein